MAELILLPYLFLLLALNSLLIVGLYNACAYDSDVTGAIIEPSKQVLWRVRYCIVRVFGDFYSKPLITCPQCMASVHSLLPYALFCEQMSNPMWWMLWPFYALSLSGLSRILHSIS